jgi:hypothetical protein
VVKSEVKVTILIYRHGEGPGDDVAGRHGGGSEYFTLAHKRQYMSLEPHIHKNEDPRPSKTHGEG